MLCYPAHGAGSACRGKNLSKETVGTIGDQKTNYALRSEMTKDEFVKEVLDGISPPPQYFAKNALLNKTGYSDLDQVLASGDTPLSVDLFQELAKTKIPSF